VIDNRWNVSVWSVPTNYSACVPAKTAGFDSELTPRASVSFFIELIAQNALQPRSFESRIVALLRYVGFPWRGLKPAFGYIRIRIFVSMEEI